MSRVSDVTDVSLTPDEDVEIFFALADCHCCINTKKNIIFFDFSDKHLDHPLIAPNVENLGIHLEKYDAYITIYDYILYALIHESLHYIATKLEKCVNDCPFLEVQNIIDTPFLDDEILEELEIKLIKP